MECNAPLAAVDKAEVLALLPPSVRERHSISRAAPAAGGSSGKAPTGGGWRMEASERAGE
jgi:hypothetical protein